MVCVEIDGLPSSPEEQPSRAIWRTGPGGSFSCDYFGLRLLVQAAFGVEGGMQFLVVRPSKDTRPDAFIGSGSGENVRVVMAEAERVATFSHAEHNG